VNDPRHDRLLELLADRALVGLAPEEAAELTLLLQQFPNEDADAFDRAAAATQLARLARIEQMPAHLASRILGPDVGNGNVRAIAPAIAAKTDPLRFAGWIAAAACFTLAVFAWLGRPQPVKIVETISSASPVASSSATPTPKPTLADERAQLASNPTAKTIAWSATKDPGATGASGDVVFSVAEQRGYMRFHGLAANDPKQHQFQLWIFDSAQDKRYPIDGGVFDVAQNTSDGSGDVIVQIQPKIRVTDPTLFAVTVENPGGVVVSKREHIVLTAAKI
jgi:hypothetical protein